MQKAWIRHALMVLLLGGLTWIFSVGRVQMHPVHRWNRAFADAAFMMLCLTLAIGPASRFNRSIAKLLPWRRELGLGLTAAAVVHVIIYASAFEWNFLRFVLRVEHNERFLLDNVFAAANWVGVIALGYLIVLALTSNNLSQRLLGRGWKFLQQQTYTVFILAIVHAGLLAHLAYQQKETTFLPVFWIAALGTGALQIAGYLKTVREQQRLRGVKSEVGSGVTK